MAQGDERFITIGNFRDSLNSTASNPQDGTAAYYLDDVSVIPIEPRGIPSGGDTSVCRGDSIRLSTVVDSITDYEWSPSYGLNSDTVSNPLASPDSTTTYTVTKRTYCDTTTAQVTVNVLDTPSVKLPRDSCVQVSDSLELSPSSMPAGAVPSWSPSQGLLDTASASTVAFPDSSSTYTLTVTDTGNGCMNSDSIRIDPMRNFPGDTLIQKGDSVRYVMDELAGLSYLWEPSAFVSEPDGHAPFLFPDSTTVFTLTKKSTCDTASGDFLIVVEEPPETVPEKELFIPNVFAPGSEGHEANKSFRVLGGPFEEYQLQVFSRWGELVFESEDPENGWDGRHHGEAMEAGVYVYRFRAVLEDGTVVEKNGDVTLLR